MQFEISTGLFLYKNERGIVQIKSTLENRENRDIEKFDADGFFDLHDFPKSYKYSRYFKSRFYKLTKDGTIRSEGLANDLRSLASGNPPRMVQRGELKCLKDLGIDVKHHHVDGRIESYFVNLNNRLKKERVTDFMDVTRMVSDLRPDTGHWVIYHEREGNRTYLDICKHGDDDYLIRVGSIRYREEFPDVFPY